METSIVEEMVKQREPLPFLESGLIFSDGTFQIEHRTLPREL